MSLKNTIRQVVSESVKIKNTLTEKNLIEQRLKFSLNGSSNLSESKRALRNERYRLINFGYDKELVRESFLDVMKGLYGNDGTDVISDIKTRLGQRIADQVKNKQEVAKLIEPAIKDITTKMDEKLKQVQNVVSGGVNPTA